MSSGLIRLRDGLAFQGELEFDSSLDRLRRLLVIRIATRGFSSEHHDLGDDAPEVEGDFGKNEVLPIKKTHAHLSSANSMREVLFDFVMKDLGSR